MKWTVTALAAAAFSLVASTASASDEDENFRKCLDGMLGGFNSGIEERACQGYFDLPSAYHFYCAQRVRTGFKTLLERDACVRFFEGQALQAMRAYVIVD